MPVRLPHHCVLLVLLLAVIATSTSQQISPPQQPAAVAADVGTPIRIPNIAERSASLAALLRRATSHTQEDASVAEIRQSLKELSSSIHDLENYSRTAGAIPDGVGSASDLLTNWAPVGDRLRVWTALLERRATLLGSDQTSLASEERDWQLTLDSQEFSELPTELQGRIRERVQSIRAARESVSAKLGESALLLDDLGEQRAVVEASMESLRALESAQRSGLLSKDGPVLWKVFTERRAPSPPVTDAYNSKAEWVKEYAYRILRIASIGLLLVLVTWGLLRGLRRTAHVWRESTNESLQALALVVNRPISSAFFVAVMLCAVSLRDVPPWMIGLSGGILLIPSLRLLPSLVPAEVKSSFYALVVLMILNDLLNLLPTTSPWFRIGLAVLQVLFLVALLWARHTLTKVARPSVWTATMRISAIVGLCIAAAVLAANVAGLVRLSAFASTTLLSTFYGAVIVRGMVVILVGFLTLLARSRRMSFLFAARQSRGQLETRIKHTLNIIGVLAFFAVVLYLTELLDPFMQNSTAFLNTDFSLGSLNFTIYHILVFLLILLAAHVLSRILRVILEAAVYPRFQFRDGQAEAFSKIMHYTVMLVGFLFATVTAGVQLSNIALLAGGLGVGIGLGLQNVVNNFVSGLILLFERPIQVGDGVTIGSTSGVVRDIGIRASLIRGWDGADVIVPNGELLSGTLTNWTHSDRNRRIEITVGVAYGSDPHQVMAILTEIAGKHELVLKEPAPAAIFTEFADSSLNFILRVWCDLSNAVSVGSEIRTKINEEFARAQIQIPFPQQDINIRGVNIHSVPDAMQNPVQPQAEAGDSAAITDTRREPES